MLLPLSGLQGLGKKLFHLPRADPLAPAHQRTRIERQAMNEELKTAKIHPVAIFQQFGHHRLVALVEGMLQIVQSDHRSGWQCGSAPVGTQLAELAVEHRPVDWTGQHEQWMLTVKDPVPSELEQVSLISLSWPLWLHEITRLWWINSAFW